MKEKGYCFNCQDEKDYEVFSRMETRVVKGVPVRVRIDYGICPECGEAMSVLSLEDANEKRVFDAYKKKVGLLTGEEIRQIRLRKGLSATLFARALCMGAKNITRYENGAIQTKEINMLLKIVDGLSDDEFYDLTEAMSGLKLRPTKPSIKVIFWTEDDLPARDEAFQTPIPLHRATNYMRQSTEGASA